MSKTTRTQSVTLIDKARPGGCSTDLFELVIRCVFEIDPVDDAAKGGKVFRVSRWRERESRCGEVGRDSRLDDEVRHGRIDCDWESWSGKVMVIWG